MTLEFKTPNKKNPAPFIRYFSFSIEQAYTDTYTEMVRILRTPAWAKSFIGKRYITLSKAVNAIEELQSEHLISKNRKVAYKDLTDLGIDPDGVSDYIPIIPKIDYSQTVVSSVLT